MTVSIVAARSENNIIGRGPDIPWYLPADLKHFKNLTTGHTIVMGRKTFDSIGRALPSRRTIVITRNTVIDDPDVTVASSLEEALRVAVPKYLNLSELPCPKEQGFLQVLQTLSSN